MQNDFSDFDWEPPEFKSYRTFQVFVSNPKSRFSADWGQRRASTAAKAAQEVARQVAREADYLDAPLRGFVDPRRPVVVEVFDLDGRRLAKATVQGLDARRKRYADVELHIETPARYLAAPTGWGGPPPCR